jgi:hypothetical protein
MPNKPAGFARGSFQPPFQPLIDQFVNQVVFAVEAAIKQRVQMAIVSALGNGASIFPRRRGRPPKNPFLAPALLLPALPTRRRPKQICPVPGCHNVAAPVFGMVCSQHKDVPRAKIKKYREARRLQQDKK